MDTQIGDKIHNTKSNQCGIVAEVTKTHFKTDNGMWWDRKDCHIVVTKEMLAWANN